MTDVFDIEGLVHDALLDAQSTGPLKTVLVGYSGGADSTALLVSAQRVIARKMPQLNVQAIHVNHGLQSTADQWQEHCEHVCAMLSVPLFSRAVELPAQGNVEAQGRHLRYMEFSHVMAHDTLLLLGHHLQDQTETLLYRLFEGRGLLPIRNHGVMGRGRFARPLLSVSPSQLRTYLSSLGYAWVEDQSNQDQRFTRNFIRAQIVPALLQRWHQLHRSLLRVASHHTAMNQALAHELSRLESTVPLSRLPSGPAGIAWLRTYVNVHGDFSVSDKALEHFLTQASQSGRASLRCGVEVQLEVYQQNLYVVSPVALDKVARSFPASVIALGDTLELPAGRLTLTQADASAVGSFTYRRPLRVANRSGGEKMVCRGGTKTVKELLREAQIPPWRRRFYPLLFEDERLICVPGVMTATTTNAPDATEDSKTPRCLAIWQPAVETRRP